MIIARTLLALSILAVVAAAAGGIRGSNGGDVGPCDESFPLAATANDASAAAASHDGRHPRRLVALPGDNTLRAYAPLCDDDSGRIDVRRLQQCIGGSCFSEFYQHCTFECTWNPPTPKPTPNPTTRPTTLSETDNPILIELRNLVEQYRLTADLRSKIVEFVRTMMEQDLGYGLEVLTAEWPGHLPGEPHSLPIEVIALGPTDVSDFATTYILELLREHKGELVNYLKKLDGTAFEDVDASFATYDPNDIASGPTDPPSVTPTVAPEPVEAVINPVKYILEEETGGIPWWVWLLVALLILGICACCVGYFMHRNREEDKKQQTMNIFVGDDHARRSHRSRRDKDGQSYCDVASRRTVRSQKTTRTARTNRTRKATSIINRSFTRSNRPEVERKHVKIAAPTMEAVSVLPPAEGIDPPEENAVVSYSQTLVLSNARGSSRKQGRDPTFYVEGGQSQEPEGLTTMNATDSILRNDGRGRSVNGRRSSDRRDTLGNRLKSSLTWKKPYYGNVDESSEYNPTRREPEAVTSDEVGSKHRASGKKKKKSKSTSGASRRQESAMDRLKRSLSWKREAPLDIDFESYDSPSMMTQPNVTDSGGDDPSAPTVHPDQPEASQRRSSKGKFSRRPRLDRLESIDV